MIQGHIFGVVKLIGMKKLIFILFLKGMGMIHAQNDSLNNNEPKLLAARIGTGLLGYQGFESDSYFNPITYYFRGQATFNSKHFMKSGLMLQYRNSLDITLFSEYTPDPSFAAYYTLGHNESKRWFECYGNLGAGVHFGKLKDVKSFDFSPEIEVDAGFTFKPLKNIGFGIQAQGTINPFFFSASVGTHISYCIPYKRSN